MDDTDWLILKTLNETGSLTKASASLFISQPALTYRLHCIEKEYHTKIFERRSKGVLLTPQGEHFVRYAEHMLVELEKLKTVLQTNEQPLEGTLRLGISTIFAKLKFAPILKQYKKQFPLVKISLKTGSSVLLLPELLKNNEIDLAILRHDFFDWPDEQYTILKEPWCLVSSRPLDLSELPGLPWIVYESATVTKAYTTFCLWWEKTFQTSPSVPIWVNTIEATIQLISSDLGWGIIPKIFLSKTQHLYSTPIYIDGKPLLHKTIMAYKKENAAQAPVNAFIDLVKKQFAHSGQTL